MCLPTPAEKGTFNTSPAISATLFKSSLFFIFVAQHTFFRSPPLPPLSPSRFHLPLSLLSDYYSWSRAAVVFPQLEAAFHPFCCVVHTNRCNGGRVKWKCPSPLFHSSVGCFSKQGRSDLHRHTAAGFSVHRVVDDTVGLQGLEWAQPPTMCALIGVDFLTFCHLAAANSKFRRKIKILC